MAEDEAENIMLVLDNGTSAFAASVSLVRGKTRTSQVFELPFSDARDYTSPQGITYYQGRVVWGREVETLILEGKVSHANVLYGLKLSLYEEYSRSDEGKRMQKQLDDLKKKDYEVLADVFQEVIKMVKPFLQKSAVNITRNDELIQSLKIEVLILVPECFSASGRSTLAAGLELAGIERFRFVTESDAAMCALEPYVKEQLYHSDNTMNVIVADGGGGTLDCVSVDVHPVDAGCHEDPFTVSGTVKSQAVPAGSQLVDQKFLDFIFNTRGEHPCPAIRAEGGIKKFMEAYQIDEPTLRAHLVASFQPVKHNFADRPDRLISFMLVLPESPKKLAMINLTREQMRGFHDPVVQIWVRTILSMVGPTTKALVFAGGFAKSQYLEACLTKTFSPQYKLVWPTQIYHVAKTKTTKSIPDVFQRVAAMPLPSNLSVGIKGNELFDEVEHPYCLTAIRENNKEKRVFKDGRVFVKDTNALKKEYVAYDIVDWIIDPDTPTTADGIRSATKELLYPVEYTEMYIEVDVVTTDRVKAEDDLTHDPLWTDDGFLQEGLALIDPIQIFNLPDLNRYGYTLDRKDDEGRHFYDDVKVLLTLQVSKEKVHLVFTLVSRNPNMLDWTQKREIWNHWRANVVRERGYVLISRESREHSNNTNNAGLGNLTTALAGMSPLREAGNHPESCAQAAARPFRAPEAIMVDPTPTAQPAQHGLGARSKNDAEDHGSQSVPNEPRTSAIAAGKRSATQAALDDDDDLDVQLQRPQQKRPSTRGVAQPVKKAPKRAQY